MLVRVVQSLQSEQRTECAAFPPRVPSAFSRWNYAWRVVDCRFSAASRHSVISPDPETLQPELVLFITGEQALSTSIHAVSTQSVVQGCVIVSVILQDYMSILVKVFASSYHSCSIKQSSTSSSSQEMSQCPISQYPVVGGNLNTPALVL